ncbi:MAG: hypothetical protein CM15mP88_2510 [Pseudomonadota bacterium]|nr:MAG: hypothetical protein CM15mP88_2510 [Pseudomonadota bacterium]
MPLVLDINKQYGTTIVLIEHDMGVVMDSLNVWWCWITDAKLPMDPGMNLRSNQNVIDAYLG